MTDRVHGHEGSTLDHANRRLFLLLLAATVVLALVAVLLFDRANAHSSVFLLANLVGPTAETLAHGQGLSVCTEAMGTVGNPVCFHAARMPLPSAVVALGATLFGDQFLRVGLFKALLLLFPLETAVWLVCRRLPTMRRRRTLAAFLLLLPFVLTPFLADIVNMQVEEGYSYSLLPLVFALLLFPAPAAEEGQGTALLFGASAAALYLAKSSMAPAVVVLTLLFVARRRRRPAQAALALLLVLAAPVGWALWQHHTSGRYTIGTSLDGINFHKGNDEEFLAHYPPPPGETLDAFDADLNRGQGFPDEWSFNDFHQRAALVFIRDHPTATERGLGRKLFAIFFTVRKLGSEPAHGAMALVETAGLILFRLLLWAAILLSLASLRRSAPTETRFAAVCFLLLVGAVAFPYLAGFAYTRHISVLIFPSALLCCRLLERSPA